MVWLIGMRAGAGAGMNTEMCGNSPAGEPVAASRDATKGRPRAGPMVVVRAPKGVEGSMLILMALAVSPSRRNSQRRTSAAACEQMWRGM